MRPHRRIAATVLTYGTYFVWVRIERCSGSECTTFSQIVALGTNVTSYQNSGLSSNTSYSYRVRAYNTGGSSTDSNVASATTRK
jgi:hypothetical protein